MKRPFLCSLYVYIAVAFWVILFIPGTIITFVIYGILRLLFLKKAADGFMWASARLWSRLITKVLGAEKCFGVFFCVPWCAAGFPCSGDGGAGECSDLLGCGGGKGVAGGTHWNLGGNL